MINVYVKGCLVNIYGWGTGQQLIKTFNFSGYQWFVAPTGIVILGPTTLSSDNVIYPDANRNMTIKFSKINNNW